VKDAEGEQQSSVHKNMQKQNREQQQDMNHKMKEKLVKRIERKRHIERTKQENNVRII
jgi:hypothetical protein